MYNRKTVTNLLASAALVVASAAWSSGVNAADQTLKVVTPIDYCPLTPEAGERLFKEVTTQFESENPGVKVEFVKIPGAYQDFITKLGLLFRSPDTAPDVADVGSWDMVQWIESGYLTDMTSLVSESDAWKGMPDSVKAETTLDGKVYAISHGENSVGLLYDMTLFQKAGIAVPWQPKTWADVLDASRKLKAAVPNIWPLWLATGTAQGTAGAIYGPENFLLGSSDPASYDAATGTWVVDSKGLREVVELYRTAAVEGRLAPSSQILNASELATPPAEVPKHNIGITVAGNWFGLTWRKDVSAPYYPDAVKEIGYAPIPTIDGHAPGLASTLTGWDFGIYANSPKKELAWKFIQLYLRKKNVIMAALTIGMIPPVTADLQDPAWTSVDPFSLSYEKLLPVAVGVPVKSGYNAWAMGLLTATEAVILDPKLSVSDAVQKMNDYVDNQLGSDKVEVKK